MYTVDRETNAHTTYLLLIIAHYQKLDKKMSVST